MLSREPSLNKTTGENKAILTYTGTHTKPVTFRVIKLFTIWTISCKVTSQWREGHTNFRSSVPMVCEHRFFICTFHIWTATRLKGFTSHLPTRSSRWQQAISPVYSAPDSAQQSAACTGPNSQEANDTLASSFRNELVDGVFQLTFVRVNHR